MESSLWLPITYQFKPRERRITFEIMSLFPRGRKTTALINVSEIEVGESDVYFSYILSDSGIDMRRSSSSHGYWGFGVCSFAGTVNESPWIILICASKGSRFVSLLNSSGHIRRKDIQGTTFPLIFNTHCVILLPSLFAGPRKWLRASAMCGNGSDPSLA